MLSDPPSDDSTIDTDEDTAMVPKTTNSGANDGVPQDSNAVPILGSYSKNHSLLHHMRLNIGPKLYIMQAILQMTYEEFCKYTHIYPSDNLCSNEAEIVKYYKYAICDPAIWPPNLYIRLGDLKEYLQHKGVHLHKLDLRCITPLILHWSNLVSSTNFDQCVQYDYYKTEGKLAMTSEMLHQRRKTFYERCWEAGEWLWRAPDVTNVELVQQVVETQHIESGFNRTGTALNDNSVTRMDTTSSEEVIGNDRPQFKLPLPWRPKRVVVAAQASLSCEVIMRYLRARVKDTSKHARILERIQCLLRSKQKQKPREQQRENIQNSVELTDDEKKRHSLQYQLRLHIGPRQCIIQAVLQMTYEEFRTYTHMFPSDKPYRDANELERHYKQAICDDAIWPSNLYVRLKDLPEYLKRKGVLLHKLDLRCIPPVLLHWCDLMTTTNFDACVQYDYYKTEGIISMDEDELPQRRADFYERCCKGGEWLWRPPDVTDNDIIHQLAEPKDLTQTTYMPTQEIEETPMDGTENALTQTYFLTEDHNSPTTVNKTALVGTMAGSNETTHTIYNFSGKTTIMDHHNATAINVTSMPSNGSEASNNKKHPHEISPKVSQNSRKIDECTPKGDNIRVLFFSYQNHRNSLHYQLRLTVGPKQAIIAAILEMTLEEFCRHVRIFTDGSLSGSDPQIEMCYRYAVCYPAIWPPNLYVTLQNLQKYLQCKGLHLRKFDLRCIPPVLLHWTDLMVTTNFDQCVQYDYYKTEGRTTMTLEMLHERRKTFYERCWEAGEWLWRAPDVTDVGLSGQIKTELDIEMMDVVDLERQAVENPASVAIPGQIDGQSSNMPNGTSTDPPCVAMNEATNGALEEPPPHPTEAIRNDPGAGASVITAQEPMKKPIRLPGKYINRKTRKPIGKTKAIKYDSAKYVPQITHQFRPLAVKVVKRKPTAETTPAISNNNNNNDDDGDKVASTSGHTDWTPSQELAADNTLFNATSLMAATETTSKAQLMRPQIAQNWLTRKQHICGGFQIIW